jgi:hypothetical protein
VSAVDRYTDLPADMRERLKARMARRAYDDMVSIRRDSITGHGRYGSTIRDMHFGTNKVCREVSRSGWSPQTVERGLVYCEREQCILVPTICHNVSRIVRAAVADELATPEALPPAADVPPVLVAASPAARDAPPLSDAPPPLDARAPLDASPPTGRESTSFAYLSGSHGVPGGGFVSGGSSSGGTPGVPIAVGGSVGPVPETETWILMLGGAAVLAAWRRRGRLMRMLGRSTFPG